MSKATISHNADGSAIVVLGTPVKFNGDEFTRVTIPAFRAKHLRRLHLEGGKVARVSDMADFAANVVEPAGVYDEMTPADGLFVAEQVMVMLGKSQATGSES